MKTLKVKSNKAERDAQKLILLIAALVATYMTLYCLKFGITHQIW